MYPRWTIAAVAVMVFALLVLSAAAQGPAKPSPEVVNVVTGNTEFGLALYSQLAGKEGSLFFSPYSISSALAMTYAGARGKTAEEMKTTMRFHLEPDRLHPAFASLGKALDNPKSAIQLRIANRLWGQKDYGFLPEFLKNAKTNYGAGLGEVDFVKNTEASRDEINAWVEKQTQGKIKDLMPQGTITPMTRLVLTNAIYFKAPWTFPFDPKQTADGEFTLASGKKLKTPLMHASERASFMQGDGFSMLELPYGMHKASMFILLPKDAGGLPQLEKQLSETNLKKWIGKLGPHQMTITLPKFKVTSQFMLNDTLKEMGMRDAFTFGKADFTGMATGEKLYISAVVHKAFVDVNEAGTEAAAATGVGIGTLSLPPPATFRADHPFVFLIRDNATDSVLFMGRLAQP